MHTLAPTRTCWHTRIRVGTTAPTQFIDITERIEALVVLAGIRTGLVHVQTLHTTTAVIVNEHEPLLLADFDAVLEKAAPLAAAYRHDDMSVRTVNLAPGERPNGHAHCRALLMSHSASLNVAHGRLELGSWQRIFLAELDGPRRRDLSVLFLGEGSE